MHYLFFLLYKNILLLYFSRISEHMILQIFENQHHSISVMYEMRLYSAKDKTAWFCLSVDFNQQFSIRKYQLVLSV